MVEIRTSYLKMLTMFSAIQESSPVVGSSSYKQNKLDKKSVTFCKRLTNNCSEWKIPNLTPVAISHFSVCLPQGFGKILMVLTECVTDLD